MPALQKICWNTQPDGMLSKQQSSVMCCLIKITGKFWSFNDTMDVYMFTTRVSKREERL